MITKSAIAIAGESWTNLRSHPNRDRWTSGMSSGGVWLAVTDGVGQLAGSSRVAERALDILRQLMPTLGLSTDDLAIALHSASISVSSFLEGGADEGATTLTSASLTEDTVSVAWLGDSFAWIASTAGQGILTPPKTSHRLHEWLGSTLFAPHTASFPINGAAVVLLGTDGSVAPPQGDFLTTTPQELISISLRNARAQGSTDDATVVVARTTTGGWP